MPLQVSRVAMARATRPCGSTPNTSAISLHNRPKPAGKFSDLPAVTVQLPLFNEMYVVERLLDSVAGVRYPRDRFQVQVLDDSTDETQEICKRKIRLSGPQLKPPAVVPTERKVRAHGQRALDQCDSGIDVLAQIAQHVCGPGEDNRIIAGGAKRAVS